MKSPINDIITTIDIQTPTISSSAMVYTSEVTEAWQEWLWRHDWEGWHMKPGGDGCGTHTCDTGHIHSVDANTSSHWSPVKLKLYTEVILHITHTSNISLLKFICRSVHFFFEGRLLLKRSVSLSVLLTVNDMWGECLRSHLW